MLNSIDPEMRPIVRDPAEGCIVNLAGLLAYIHPFKQGFLKCIIENCPYTVFHNYKEQMSSGNIFHESGRTFSSLPQLLLPLRIAISKRNLEMTNTILSSSVMKTDKYLPLVNRTVFLIDNICYGIALYHPMDGIIEDKILARMQKTIYKFVQESGRIGDSTTIDKLKNQIIPYFEGIIQTRVCAEQKNIDRKVIVFLQGLEFAFVEGKAEAEGRGV
jgi:hypothetical protein